MGFVYHYMKYVGVGALLILAIIGAVYAVFLWRVSPLSTIPEGWVEARAEGITFYYPPMLTTRYISPVDWPPQILVGEGQFMCTEAGEEMARAGRTEPQIIRDREYCVTKVTEGAAGSIYTQYSYITTLPDNKLINFLFSLRFVQCGNYDEAQRIECEKERAAFDIGPTVNQIVETF